MEKTIDMVLVGVGGQGTLVAGKVLARVAERMGLDVKISEVHGMSQRGGSVITHVRMGRAVASPLVEEGRAGCILAFEPLEALRWAPLLAEDGALFMNDESVVPQSVRTGAAAYPDGIAERLREAAAPGVRVHVLPAGRLARESGSARAVNMVLLGAFSRESGIPEPVFRDAIRDVFPERLRSINLDAFEAGRAAV